MPDTPGHHIEPVTREGLATRYARLFPPMTFTAAYDVLLHLDDEEARNYIEELEARKAPEAGMHAAFRPAGRPVSEEWAGGLTR